MKTTNWTNSDASAAEAEGWNLFNLESHPEIQRDDEAGIFDTDEDAVAFVKASQSRHCLKAAKIMEAARPRVRI